MILVSSDNLDAVNTVLEQRKDVAAVVLEQSGAGCDAIARRE